MSNSVLSCRTLMSQQTQQTVVLPITTSPNNKRVKVTLACVVCRKKKVKCDGIQPTCSRCNLMGFSCHYSDPPKKRGPPKGQVEIIESRAHRIESLRVAGTGISQNNNNNTEHDHKISPSVSPLVMMDMVSENNDLSGSLDNKDENINKKLFSLENNTILHLISGAVDAIQSNNKWSLTHQDSPGSHYLKNDFFMKDDPMVNQYQKWATCYFGYFNIFFPVLSQPHFMRQLSEQTVDPLLLYAVCAIGAKYSENDQETSTFYYERCQCILNMSRDPITLSTVQALVILCWYSYLLGNMQTCCDLRHRLLQSANDLQLCRDPGSSLGIVDIEMRRRAFWVIFVTDQWLSCCTGERLWVIQDGWTCQWPQLEDSQLMVIDSKIWKLSTTHHHCTDNNHDQIYQQNGHHQNQQPTTDSSSSSSSSSCFMPDLSAEYALQITAFSEMIKLACIVGDMHSLYSSSTSSSFSSTTRDCHQPIIVSRLTDWLLRLPPYLEYDKPKDDSPPSPIARMYHMLYYTVQIMLHQPFVQQQQQEQGATASSISLSLSSLSSTASSISSASFSSNLDNVSKIPNSSHVNMAQTICTNAANTIIHIAEQMIKHKQQTYLHNTFMSSLTLAASIHLDTALNLDRKHQVSSLLNLDKSFFMLKSCNSSILASSDLGKLLDRFLLDHYGIRLNDKKQQIQQQGSPRRFTSNMKRTMDDDSTNDGSTSYEDETTDAQRKRRVQRKNRNTPRLLAKAATTSTDTTPLSSPSALLSSPSSLSTSPIMTWDSNDKDDLLDTRLHSLLNTNNHSSYSTTTTDDTSYTNHQQSPPTSLSHHHGLDPTWLDETSSILDLFPESSSTTLMTPPTTLSSPSSQYFASWPLSPPCSLSIQSQQSYIMTPSSTETLHSPSSSISPTQSPTLSSDSNNMDVTTQLSSSSSSFHIMPGADGDNNNKDYFQPPSSDSLFYYSPSDSINAMDIYASISNSTFIPSFGYS